MDGFCRMRSCASLIRSSRSPNFVAPVGQISAHAVCLPASHAIRAHNAFAHPRIQRVPFVLRLGKRAGHHAIAAADALPDVVDDGALLCLMKGANRTSRRASGMLAVHAQPTHELVVLGQNDRVFMFRLHRLRRYCVVVRQFVLLRAGLLHTACNRCTSSRHTAGPYSWKLLLVSSQARLPFQWNEVRGRLYAADGTDLETAQNSFGRANCEERAGSGVVSIRTRQGCSILEKRAGEETSRLATDRPSFGSVRRIEPDIFILTLTPSSAAARQFVARAAARRAPEPGTANRYFCRLRMYDTTIFTWSGGRALHRGGVLCLLRNVLGQVVIRRLLGVV